MTIERGMNKPILLVEDEEHDVLFMQMALDAVGAKNPLSVAKDGCEAIDYLRGDGMYADRRQYPLPGLMLLDLRLPRVPGFEVLRWLRQQPAFAKLPVLVLSSSDQDSDVEAAYQLGADGYLVKPPLPSRLQAIVALIKKYWLDLDAPPPDCPGWQAVIVSPPATAERRRTRG